MTVSPEDDQSLRSMAAEIGDQPSDDREHLFAFGSFSRPENSRDQIATETFIDMKRHKAVITVIAIEEPLLLLAISLVFSVIKIQDNHFGRFIIRRDELIDKDFA